ncbi:TPA: hypothetical protein QCG56_003021 [Enterobacter cancerogenus]|nr:hypothetical protein [Enterobacter cancerogenus]HDR2166150.1 hypothetical protein [Enterobacter cancerogenus]HDR2268731.1 hypothetical protein [Enterobacter cancerogenus]
MAKRNRSTLKNYFRHGTMPSSEHFSDLIDSCVNHNDEGFIKPPETGLQLRALDQEHLLSFYQQNSPETPLWHVGFAPQSVNLHVFANPQADITDDSSAPAQAINLSMTPTGKVGINTATPQQTLDVNGTVASQGRMGGRFIDTPVPADGEWHDITPELEGCHMFEVVAGVGIRYSGRYALAHAIAINTCAPNKHWWHLSDKNPIRMTQAFFHSSADKIQLRWRQNNHKGTVRPYTLQIRTNTPFGDNLTIQYHITQLWNDPFMQQSQHRVAGE